MTINVKGAFMFNKTKLLLAAVFALFVLSAAAGTAGAAEFEIRPAGAITAVSLGLVTFGSSAVNTTCEVELIGSLNTGRIAKVAGTEFGKITSARVTPCNEGISARALVEALRPWRLNYNSILGTLPSNVTGILFRIVPVEFQIVVPGLCTVLLRDTVRGIGALLAVTGNNPYTSGLIRILEAERIAAIERSSILCPGEGRLIGTFGLRPTQTITRF